MVQEHVDMNIEQQDYYYVDRDSSGVLKLDSEEIRELFQEASYDAEGYLRYIQSIGKQRNKLESCSV